MKKTLSLMLVLSLLIAMLSGCSTSKQPESTVEPTSAPEPTAIAAPEEAAMSADIVVVGSGLAGMGAATYAAQNGASVIVVDKQGFIGGGIVSSPGNMAVAEIAENEEFHLNESDDTLAAASDRWLKAVEDGSTPSNLDLPRVESLMLESMKTISWLTDMGAVFSPSFTIEANGLAGYRPDVPSIESGLGGAKLVALMQKTAEAAGAAFLPSTPATSLVSENGKVTGVVVQTAEGEKTISAKAVILATGGFGANEEMVLTAIPALAETGVYYQGIAANTGDGINMATEIGAATYENPWLVATTLTPHGDLIAANKQFGKLVEGMIYTVKVDGDPIEGASIADQIIVNKDGKRVINEAGNKSRQLAVLIDSGTAPYYALYSNVTGELAEILDSGISTGYVFKSDSISDLAEAAGIDANTLMDTVSEYNGFVAEGEDTAFGKPAERMHTVVDEGSYYLVRVVPSYVATMGGIMTNDNYQAVTADGTAIDGLYAVGEMAHRFLYTRHFIGGASNGFSTTMGRLAAEHAIANLG